MWLTSRTDAENGKPCYYAQSASGKMTHIWLDNNKWQILQRQDNNGPDNMLASLTYAGGFPLPSDNWNLEPVLGNGGVLSVHIWSWSQYEAKKKEATNDESKFKHISEQIRDLKATMQHDVADIKEKVATWEVDRGMMYESVTDLTEMVTSRKRRQDSCDSEVKALLDQTQRPHREASPLPRKKKRCFCDGRSRVATKRDWLQEGTPVKFLHNSKIENRVVSRRAERGGYWLTTGKHGSHTWASEKHLFINDHCRDCHRATTKS
jgi:hypothetical protein